MKANQHPWQLTPDEHIATIPSLFLSLVRTLNMSACIPANGTTN
jgi:hypothetical protein